MTDKHTPGPWKVRYNAPRRVHTIHKDGAVHITICKVVQTENDETNARLIALAPEMVELLTLVNSSLLASGSVNIGSPIGERIRSLLSRINMKGGE